MRASRERNRQRAIARAARVKPWGDLPAGSLRGAGLLLIDKDPGVTSHDVVGAVRRLAGTRQVGHAGTLDPMATGLLIVAVGRMTKLIQYMVGSDKTYEARIRLGISSSTDDAEGELAPAAPVTATDEEIDAALTALTGDIMQVPSTVSAIKIDGKRAHDLAREGADVELAARPIHVDRFERTSPIRRGTLEAGGLETTAASTLETASVGALETDVVEFDVVVTASSGTYVRALARDVGEALGTGAHLTSLRRTRIGPWHVEGANTVSQLKELVLAGQELPAASLGQVSRQVFPTMEINEAEARALRNGLFIGQRAVASPGTWGEPWPAATFLGDVPIALVSPRGGELKPDLQLTL